MKPFMVALLVAFLSVVVPGCSLIPERTVYETVALPAPPEPDYPRIPADELECLSDEAYEALVRRDMLKSRYIGQLRAVIESTP